MKHFGTPSIPGGTLSDLYPSYHHQNDELHLYLRRGAAGLTYHERHLDTWGDYVVGKGGWELGCRKPARSLVRGESLAYLLERHHLTSQSRTDVGTTEHTDYCCGGRREPVSLSTCSACVAHRLVRMSRDHSVHGNGSYSLRTHPKGRGTQAVTQGNP